MIGAYPTDSYFDPGRPEWLPYWIDTPTESALKYQVRPSVTSVQTLPAPPAAKAPAAPATRDQMTKPGQWTPGQAATEAQRQSVGTWGEFYGDLASQEAARQAARLADADSRENSALLLVAGLGVIGLVLLFR